jgi:hypothetical protein
VAWAIFAGAALISILVLAFAGRGQTLKGDEWGYARDLATLPLSHVLFDPPAGKYLLVLPLLLYKGAFSTFGISDYTPYRLAGMALTVLVAALFMILAARRLGYLPALLGAVLILFLGSSSEVTTTALRIPIQIAMAAGLGMLLALERRGRRADIAACVLLVIAVTSHPLGLAFAGAAAVIVLARPAPDRWRRAWIFAVPMVLFAAWYVTLREPAPNSASIGHQLTDLPRFEFQSLATMAAAISGTFRSPFNGHINFLNPVSYLLAVVIIAGVGFRVMTTRLPATFWAILTAVLILFAAPAFAPGVLRSPTASRYVFPGVIMLLLLICETVRGVQIGERRVRIAAVWATAAILAVALYSNITVLDKNARFWASQSKQVRAELAALDLAQGSVDPSFQAEGPTSVPRIPYTHMTLTAGEYFAVKAAFGTPAFSPTELHSAPLADRHVADVVLARALDLKLRPAPSLNPSAKAERPKVVTTTGTTRDSGPSCVTIAPRSGPAGSQVALPRGGIALSTSGGSPVGLVLGRFGGYGYPLQQLQPRGAAVLVIPPDLNPTPWRLLVGPAQQPVTACGLDLASFQQ